MLTQETCNSEDIIEDAESPNVPENKKRLFVKASKKGLTQSKIESFGVLDKENNDSVAFADDKERPPQVRFQILKKEL